MGPAKTLVTHPSTAPAIANWIIVFFMFSPLLVLLFVCVFVYRDSVNACIPPVIPSAGNHHYWLSLKNCCEPVMGMVTVFCPLTTMGAGELVVQTADGPRFVVDCTVNPE
jgi:hypothetical protein